MMHNFDPWTMLEQIQVNQQQLDINLKNIILVTNQNTKGCEDHEQRLDLMQKSINSILGSLQNQQKLLMGLFDMMTQLQAVNNSNKGQE